MTFIQLFLFYPDAALFSYPYHHFQNTFFFSKMPLKLNNDQNKLNISNVAYDELESAYLLCKNLYVLLQRSQTFLQPVEETYFSNFFFVE